MTDGNTVPIAAIVAVALVIGVVLFWRVKVRMDQEIARLNRKVASDRPPKDRSSP